MEFSSSFISIMRDFIKGQGNRRIFGTLLEKAETICYADITKDENSNYEIPWFALSSAPPGDPIKTINRIPIIYCNAARGTIPTGADAVIKYMLRNAFHFGEIMKVTTTKGFTYYGSNGMIFNKDKELLFMGTVNIQEYEFCSDITSINIYLSPKVLLNQDDILCKHIIKKIIPYILSDSNATSPLYNGLYSNVSNQAPINIKVGIPNFIKAPNKPLNDNLDSEINNLLITNIKEFILGFNN